MILVVESGVIDAIKQERFRLEVIDRFELFNEVIALPKA
jgi:hypothetical protein